MQIMPGYKILHIYGYYVVIISIADIIVKNLVASQ